MAKIYRDLMYISLQKDLSFGERTLLQNIEDLIAQELQVVKNLSREVTIQNIRIPFKHITELTQMSFSGPDKMAHIE
jgi:RNA polymerase-interacting CarD/CdnL/TRCF family regulator